MGKFTKRLLVFAVSILGASFLGYLLAQFESGNISFGAKDDYVEDVMGSLEKIDPMNHAVLMDHIGETRQILETAHATNDWEAGRAAVSALILEYGIPALGRTSDALAISTLERARDLIRVLSAHLPESCKGLALGNLPSEALELPQVKSAFARYSDVRRLAYEDGKNRNAPSESTASDVDTFARRFHKLDDLKLGSLIKSTSGKDVCAGLLQLYDTVDVPQAETGAYARGILIYSPVELGLI